MTEEKKKLGLLDKPEFWRYLINLPVQSFRTVVVIDEETGKATYIESKQQGDSPPQVVVSKE